MAVGPDSATRPASSDDDAVGERDDVEQVVRDEHRGPAVAHQHAAQHRAHRGGHADVEPGQRFVEQQHLGFGGQGAGQRDALGLPAGQLARFAVGQVGGLDLGEPALGRRPGRRRADRVPLRGAEADVGRHGQVGKQQGVLHEQADAAVVGGDVHAGGGVGQHAGPRRAPCPRRAAPDRR